MERKLKDSGHSWIGMIPEHWELHYLRGISNGFRKGDGITKEDLNPDGDIACVRYGDLYTKYDHYITTVECRTNVSKIKNPVYASYGDIYFTCSGEDVEAIGKSIAFLSKDPCLVGGDLIIMKHSQDPKFLGYSLDSYISQKQKSFGKSKLKVVHISVKDLKNIAVPLPPLAEQEAIATYLDKKCGEIDELIEVEQQMISELESYRQSVITEAVTRGLNPEAPEIISNIPWVSTMPSNWKEIRLKFLSKIATGDKDTIMATDDGEYPFFVRSPKIEKIDTYSYDGEAILMAGDGVGAGRVFHHYKGKFDWHQRVYNLHELKNINGRFLYYFLLSNFHKLIDAGSAKSTVDSVRMPMLTNFVVLVPPLSEQQEIVDYLDNKCAEIEELINIKQEKIDTLKQYRQSLIFEAVTGKITI